MDMLSISRELPKPKRGDLVKWYSYYQDQIISDAGYGIVLAVDVNYYKIYMFEDRLFRWFAGCDVEPVA